MPAGAHHDAPARRRELERVGQEIEEHLLDLALVGADGAQTPVDVVRELDAMPVRALAHEDQRVLDGAGKVEFGGLELHPSRLDLGQVEDVVDEREEVSRRLQDVAQVIRLLFVDLAEQPLGQHLGEADDRVQRRAQLVRHVGEEFALVPARRLELAALLLDLAEQPRVLDGQRGLRRERLHELDHLGREAAGAAAVDGERAQELVLAEKRHRQHRTIAAANEDVAQPARIAPLVRDVRDLDRLAGDREPPEHALALADGRRPERVDQLVGQPVRRVQLEFLARVVVLPDRSAVQSGELGRARDDRRQHDLQIEGRADGPADLAQRLAARSPTA